MTYVMTLKSRNDGINILIYDARVQGDGAVKSLISALNAANNDNKCDVLIIGRGGGSFEDLLPFSDEKLVRAVADSKTPIISAVGHEPDVALTDFAADVRASTPSVAANLVSSVTKDDIYNALFNYQKSLKCHYSTPIKRQLYKIQSSTLKISKRRPFKLYKALSKSFKFFRVKT